MQTCHPKCPTARSPICICSCGGANHGGGAVSDVIGVTVEHLAAALVFSRYRRWLKAKTYKPKFNGPTWRKKLRRAGFVYHVLQTEVDGSWGFQQSLGKEADPLMMEVLKILDLFELQNPTGKFLPQLNEKVLAEIEHILKVVEESESEDELL